MKPLLLFLVLSLPLTAFGESPRTLITTQGENISFPYQGKEHHLFIGQQIYREDDFCFLEASTIQGVSNENKPTKKTSIAYVIEIFPVDCSPIQPNSH